MGKVTKQIFDTIVSQRGNGNPIMVNSITTRLVLKGIDVKKISETLPDDPKLIEKLTKAAEEMGVTL
jgi:hypothetical protein